MGKRKGPKLRGNPKGLNSQEAGLLAAWQAFHPGRRGFAGKRPGVDRPVRPGDLSRLREPTVRRFIEGIGRQQREARSQGVPWSDRPHQNPLAAQMRAVRDALERQKSKPGEQPFAGVGGGGLVGGGKPGTPGKPPKGQPVAGPAAAPARPSPEDVFRYTAAANRTRDWRSQGLDEWLSTAASEEGLDPADVLPLLRTAALKESTGRPDAVNDWDSNAAKGTPSKGLMQTIDPTFRAHAEPGWDVFNPVQNTRAAIRYARSKYGDRWLQAMAYGANPSRGGGY